ncbi:MAG: hypothetical protein MUC96_00720 [Myxococcaceae bacterium]|jgi:hypothetical protein|nr:hypothetical protein [Myxococcaceae bacterium]
MPNVSGPTGPRPLTGTSTASTPTPAAPAQPTTPAGNTGWAAGTGPRGSVNPNVNTPAPNAADVQATLPNPVRTAVHANIERFNSRLEQALGHDAMSMARGRTPVREGDVLTDAQQTELRNAATDFIKDMPLGALDPTLAREVQSRLESRGVQVRDIASTRLGDLGDIGADIAKDLLKDLRSNSPAAFYGLAAGAAVAAGYAAWSGGSAKLQSLGIKPELKAKFFDDQLEVKLRGDWQAHFKDFKPSATVTYNYTNDAWRLSASATVDSGGLSRMGLNGSYTTDTLAANAYVNANRSGLENIGGSVVYRPNDDFRLSAGVDHNFQTNRTTANAEAAWRVRDNVDFALSASHDSRGDSRVGVGLRVTW